MRESVQSTLFPVEKSRETARKSPSTGVKSKPRRYAGEASNTQHAELLLDFIGSGGGSWSDILGEARRLNVSRSDCEEILEKMKVDGLLYEPRYREFRVV